jgi:hypothetical protein
MRTKVGPSVSMLISCLDNGPVMNSGLHDTNEIMKGDRINILEIGTWRGLREWCSNVLIEFLNDYLL